jgi:RHS repeat-associated protein
MIFNPPLRGVQECGKEGQRLKIGVQPFQETISGSDFLAPALLPSSGQVPGEKSEHKTYCTHASGFMIFNPPLRGVQECGKEGQRLKIGVQHYTYTTTVPGRCGFSSQPYRYAYQGQFAERNSVTQNLDFMLRSYDPRIGRWTTTDPLYQYFSPYTGMGNNPVIYVDPTGGKDEVKEATDDGRVTIIAEWGGEFFSGLDIGSLWYRTYMGFYNGSNIGGTVACSGSGGGASQYVYQPGAGPYQPESFEGRTSIVHDGNNTLFTVNDAKNDPGNGGRYGEGDDLNGKGDGPSPRYRDTGHIKLRKLNAFLRKSKPKTNQPPYTIEWGVKTIYKKKPFWKEYSNGSGSFDSKITSYDKGRYKYKAAKPLEWSVRIVLKQNGAEIAKYNYFRYIDDYIEFEYDGDSNGPVIEGWAMPLSIDLSHYVWVCYKQYFSYEPRNRPYLRIVRY